MATDGTIKKCVAYMIENYPGACDWKITEKSLIFETRFGRRKIIPLKNII